MSDDDAPTRTGEARNPAETRSHARGELVDKFIVLGEVGAGGMGVILEAYDPGLDRRVALKLLRTVDAGAGGRARLEREAQAMARVVHPNVVTVYQAGTVGDQVYVAMELVEGGTLREWLRERPRGWHEVVATFVAAGRGLAAAHRAGLVHRDFKPDNVLVGRDGRVCVTDFGLVAAAFEPAAALLSPVDSPLDDTLTAPGNLVGTPSYMAPEQHLGLGAGPAADQFAFCVALHEGLWHKRPFSGRSLGEIAEAVTAGRVEPPPEGSRVPAWLRQVVLRGLATDPAARWPSMDALLAALGRDPTQLRRRIAAGSAAGIAALALGFAALRGHDAATPCTGAERRLAGVWDEGARARTRAGFEGSGAPHAAETWGRFAAALDAHSASWVRTHTATCEATRVRGEQSEVALDLRMACLDRRLGEAQALASLYERPDEAMVGQAPLAAFKLGRPERCAAPEIVTSRLEPPPAGAAPAVATLRTVLARADALFRAGRYPDGRAVAEAALAAARAVGFVPLEAEALFSVGVLTEYTGAPAEAAATLYRAVTAAKATRHHEVEADAWTELVFVTGKDLARYEEAQRLAAIAGAAVTAAGEDPARAAMLDLYVAEVLSAKGKHHEALERHRRTLARRESLYGRDHPDVAKALNNLGGVLYQLGQLAEAEDVYHRAAGICATTLGPRHVLCGRMRGNLGEVLRAAGKLDGAEAELTAAAEITAENLGPDALSVGMVHSNLALLLQTRGRRAEARAAYERALAIFEKRRGPDHPDLAYQLQGLGELAIDEGDGARALPLVERALRLREAAKTDPVRVAESKVAVGRALLVPGKTHDGARARKLFAEARPVLVEAGDAGKDVLAVLEASAGGQAREVDGQDVTSSRTSAPPGRSRSRR